MHHQDWIKNGALGLTGFISLVMAVLGSEAVGKEPQPTAPVGYQEACEACHAAMVGGMGDHLYRRADRLVNDYEALSRRVRYCSQGTETGWDDSQIEAVTDYLNQRYYHFKQR